MLDAVQPIAGPKGRPRKRPGKLHADKGYDSEKNRSACLAWLHRYRRLLIRWERRDDCLIAFRFLLAFC